MSSTLAPGRRVTGVTGLRDAVAALAVCIFATGVTIAAVCPDADTDGYADCRVPGCDTTGQTCGDCDDADPGVNPGAQEICNNRDDNCDASVDENFPRIDFDEEIFAPATDRDDHFGWAIGSLGDVTGDGVIDFAVAAPNDYRQDRPHYGSVTLYSGSDRSIVCMLGPEEPTYSATAEFGADLTEIGDVSGDGIRDFAVGDPGEEPKVYVFSGADCSLIRELTDPDTGWDNQIGRTVAKIGDLTGEGTPEIAAWSAGEESIVVFSGTDGSLLMRLTDPESRYGDQLGFALTGIDDLDDDGFPEILAGAPAREQYGGKLVIFSGAHGTVLRTSTLGHAGARFGAAVAALGDIDGDGVSDIGAGAPDHDGVGTSMGAVYLLSGVDGSLIDTLYHPVPQRDRRFGHTVAALADRNADGIPDFAVASVSARDSDRRGEVLVYSGADRALLERIEAPMGQDDALYGQAIAEVGDYNGDGVRELVIGAPEADSIEGLAIGRAFVHGTDSDCDDDGVGVFYGDCDDTDSSRFPGRIDACDGVDNDCDPFVDEDNDGDGVGICNDCHPLDHRIYPGAPERCNGLDDDCDDLIDEGDDNDADGHTTPCDCDDLNDAVFPGQTEVCNRSDDNCEGWSDEGFPQATVEFRFDDRVGEVHDESGKRFGTTVADIGDLTGDGFPEIAVGGPEWNDDLGSVVIFDGRTREYRCRLRDPDPGYYGDLGRSLAAIGDVTGDGVPDVAAGSPDTGRGAVLVFSGATCRLEEMLTHPSTGYGDLGYSVAAVGDLDGVGVSEFAAGGPDEPGTAVVFSGAEPRDALFVLEDPFGNSYDEFGGAVAGIDDITGDGVPDIAVGAPADGTRYNWTHGSVSIFSGATGEFVRKLVDPSSVRSGERLGSAILGIPDVDGDGVGEIVAGVPRYDWQAGRVVIFSGADGTVFRRVTSSGESRLGTSLALYADVSGDGRPEILVGAPMDYPMALLLDPLTGRVEERFEVPLEANSEFGTSVARLDDVTGDGNPEILVGAPRGQLPGGSGGMVVMYVLEGDCDGDGHGPSGTDCDDSDPQRRPGAPERCNSLDDDCDAEVDEDTDGDGFAACQDCDNANPTVRPGVPERCNGIDDDCNGLVDDGPDLDDDGHMQPCDCNDAAAAVHPGAGETCNHLDDNCDGIPDEDWNPRAAVRFIPAPTGAMNYGAKMASVGDLDGDGRPEYAVSAPGSGEVWIHSGVLPETRCTLTLDGENGSFGAALAGGGDATGDGIPDLYVGAPGAGTPGDRSGSVFLFSGADCTLARRISNPSPSSASHFGTSLAAADFTGDGVLDIVAVAGHVVTMLDGATGWVIRTYDDWGFDGRDIAVAPIGDVNADGVPDLLVGLPRDDRFNGDDSGTVVVFSGASEAIIHHLYDPEPDSDDRELGGAVAAIDDITGDGVPDVIAGGGGFASASHGEILLFSGSDGIFLRRLTDPSAGTSGRVGASVAGLPDVTGDGVPDVLAGAPGWRSYGGWAVIFSGANGSIYRRFFDADAAMDGRFANAVGAIGDVTGDGIVDGAASYAEGLQDGFLLFSTESDCDLDSYTPIEGDCEDQDAGINPGIVDLCGDDIDLDCRPGDGTGEPWYGTLCDGSDLDLCTEGSLSCVDGAQGCTDLTDHSAEVCSGEDDDCNGEVDDPSCAYYEVNGDGLIDGAELSWIGRAFGLCSNDPAQEWWGAADYSGDGCIDGIDLSILGNLWSRGCDGAVVDCD